MKSTAGLTGLPTAPADYANIDIRLQIMIGHDESQEEVTFKVTDRRKFNPDGSLKEGVEIEPEKAAEPERAARPEPP
jgi:hypothetical protein